MLLIKLVAKLVELALMAAIALIGLGIGLYCFSGLISLGSARPDRLVHLTAIRDGTGSFLGQVTRPGPTAGLALVCGAGAVAIAIILLIGLLGSRREQVLVLDPDGDQGTLAARPRAISGLVRSEAEAAPGVTGARRPRVKLKRNGTGGRLRVRASRGPDPDSETVDRNVHARVDPIAERLSLRPDVRIKLVQPKNADDADRGAG